MLALQTKSPLVGSISIPNDSKDGSLLLVESTIMCTRMREIGGCLSERMLYEYKPGSGEVPRKVNAGRDDVGKFELVLDWHE